ncbi:MAG: hypothetical protein RL653_744 [Pseudomonadota bacterium]|jgi:carbonic anhydrase
MSAPSNDSSRPDAPTLDSAQRLLTQNRQWATAMKEKDPEFFSRLAKGQSPRFLWIGCSDSRVPADTITGTQPGEIFIHRNIANTVVHTDLNLLSVLTYAVEVLKVEHVVVCGHAECGGVRAAMSDKDLGQLNHWLRNIKDVYAAHYEELHAISSPEEREYRLIELNAIEQVKKLAATGIIQRAWATRSGPWLHAWVYRLSDGMLHEVTSIAPGSPVPAPYAFSL